MSKLEFRSVHLSIEGSELKKSVRTICFCENFLIESLMYLAHCFPVGTHNHMAKLSPVLDFGHNSECHQ